MGNASTSSATCTRDRHNCNVCKGTACPYGLDPTDLAYQAAGAWKERALKAEARLASLTSVSEEDVERAMDAMGAIMYPTTWPTVRKLYGAEIEPIARAALTAFVRK